MSVAVVTDPFGEYDVADLRTSFGDVVIRFKEHWIADLRLSPHTFVSRHHQRYVRAALQKVDVERSPHPDRLAAEWVTLYQTLIERRNVRGIVAFSPVALERQLSVPGLVMLRATRQGQTVGMILWYVQGDIAYYHLGAYSEHGYDLRVSFALFWRAFEVLAADGVRWLDLGASPGLSPNNTDGLSRFKRGWATDTRATYFCGRVLQRRRYEDLVKARGEKLTSYFPAYRVGEFQ